MDQLTSVQASVRSKSQISNAMYSFKCISSKIFKVVKKDAVYEVTLKHWGLDNCSFFSLVS